jgi:hypothetical protein
VYLCCGFFGFFLELSQFFPIGGKTRELLVGGV